MCYNLPTTILVSISILLTGANDYAKVYGNTVLADEMEFTRLFPEWRMTVPEIISYMGYPVEIHTVTNKDGYILEMHRIPNKMTQKPPVLFLHGLISSSADYIINNPNESLAYILHDAGYDVWLGNYRGNIYSNRHVKYDSDSEEYWNFRAVDVLQDLAYNIDYVLNETNYQQLYYGGISFGSTGILAFLSRNPEYNSKVKYIISIAPVVHTRYMRGVFPMFCNYASQFGLPPSWQHQIPPNLKQLRPSLGQACYGKKAAGCMMMLASAFGAFSDHINMTRLPLYLRQLVGGTSSAVIRLACQVVTAKGAMRDYDYGRQENMLRYRQNEPPGFDLSKVTSPMFIYYSYGDFFSCPGDIKYICETVRNCQGSYAIPALKYNHVDFLWATNNRVLVFDQIVNRLDEYESKWKI